MENQLKSLEQKIEAQISAQGVQIKALGEQINKFMENFRRQSCRDDNRSRTQSMLEGRTTTVPGNSSISRNLSCNSKVEFPKLDGSNARTWIQKCERYFVLCKIPAEQQVYMASLHVTGKAKEWITSYLSIRKFVIWIDFIEALVGRFRDETFMEVCDNNSLLEVTSESAMKPDTLTCIDVHHVFDEVTDPLLDNELEEYVSNDDVDGTTNEADVKTGEGIDLEKLEHVLPLIQSGDIEEGSLQSSIESEKSVELLEKFVLREIEAPHIPGANLIGSKNSAFALWDLLKELGDEGLLNTDDIFQLEIPVSVIPPDPPDPPDFLVIGSRSLVDGIEEGSFRNFKLHVKNSYTSAMLITFVLFGKYLETLAKGKTSDAIKKLVELAPATAVLFLKCKGGNITGEKEINGLLIHSGDVLRVLTGTKVHVDRLVVWGTSYVNKSMVTREAILVFNKSMVNRYSQVLLDHGDRVLVLANLAFEGISISATLSALMLKKHGAALHFTCVELYTLDQQDFSEALADALSCHDREGYNKILENIKPLNDLYGRIMHEKAQFDAAVKLVLKIRADSKRMKLKDFVATMKELFRKVIMEQMEQSLNKEEGGLQDCTRDVLAFYQEGSCTRSVKEAVHFCDSGLWKHTLFRCLISTEFTELCDLFFGNFYGMKANSVFDLGWINSRINKGVYESSPMSFYSDIQQLWTKLRKIGIEMVTLSMSLSEMSRAPYHNKFHRHGTNERAEGEQTEACCHKATACRQCEEKVKDVNCLFCESCEEIYYVTCIEPVQETSHECWTCAKCWSKGIVSHHESHFLSFLISYHLGGVPPFLSTLPSARPNSQNYNALVTADSFAKNFPDFGGSIFYDLRTSHLLRRELCYRVTSISTF